MRGQHANEMYFLLEGEASFTRGSAVIRTLKAGSYFGDIGCLMTQSFKYGLSVKANTTCELATLAKDDLRAILDMYPDVEDDMHTIALGRDKA